MEAEHLLDRPARTEPRLASRESQPKWHERLPGVVAKERLDCGSEDGLAAELELPVNPLAHLVQGLHGQPPRRSPEVDALPRTTAV